MKTYYFLLGILLSTVSLTDCCSSRKIPKSRPPPPTVTVQTPISHHPLSPQRLPANLATVPKHSISFNEATSNNHNQTLPEIATTAYVTTYKTTDSSTTANETHQPPSSQQPPLTTAVAASIPTGPHRQDAVNRQETTIENTTQLQLTTNKNTNNTTSQKEIDAVADGGDKNDQQQQQLPERKPEQHYAHQCPPFFEANFCLHGGKCYYYNIGNGNGTFQLFYCVCSKDYFGERCESKSLDGSYHADLLQSSKRIRIETASICFGACLAFLLVILVLYTFYYYTKPSSLRQRY